jgi:hypothetical protein
LRKWVDLEGDRRGRLSTDAWNMTWKRANNRVLIYISVLAETWGGIDIDIDDMLFRVSRVRFPKIMESISWRTSSAPRNTTRG